MARKTKEQELDMFNDEKNNKKAKSKIKKKKVNKIKEEEFDNLTSDNNNLKAELNKWKKRFLNIINFIKNRLLRPKDKDKYKKFTIDLYEHNVIDQETFDDIRNNYSKDKRKDDFKR